MKEQAAKLMVEVYVELYKNNGLELSKEAQKQMIKEMMEQGE